MKPIFARGFGCRLEQKLFAPHCAILAICAFGGRLFLPSSPRIERMFSRIANIACQLKQQLHSVPELIHDEHHLAFVKKILIGCGLMDQCGVSIGDNHVGLIGTGGLERFDDQGVIGHAFVLPGAH